MHHLNHNHLTITPVYGRTISIGSINLTGLHLLLILKSLLAKQRTISQINRGIFHEVFKLVLDAGINSGVLKCENRNIIPFSKT